jgi:hypothetical protein
MLRVGSGDFEDVKVKPSMVTRRLEPTMRLESLTPSRM